MRQKAIFIIPGFHHTPANKAYKQVAALVKVQGYSPILVSIPWKNTTISENTEYFLQKYEKVHARKKYILGFSFGAMIAFIAATKVPVKGLILCSLSPFFKEDMFQIPKSKSSALMLERYQDFSKLHCGRLAQQIKADKTLLLYGTKEARSLITRVNEAYDQIPSTHKYLMPILKTDHDLGDRRYLQKIHQITNYLSD